jgi:hypothetical protein
MSTIYSPTYYTTCVGALLDAINNTPTIGILLEQIVDDGSPQLQFYFETTLDTEQQTAFEDLLSTFVCPVVTDISSNETVVDDSSTGTNILWSSTQINNAISTGSVAEAVKLATPVNISLTNDVIGNTSFDGSTNVSINTTLKDNGVTPGIYGTVSSVGQFTVDSTGRVTSAQDLEISLDAGTF